MSRRSWSKLRNTELAREASRKPNDDEFFRMAQKRLRGAKVDITGSEAMARLNALDAADRAATERRAAERKPIDLGDDK